MRLLTFIFLLPLGLFAQTFTTSPGSNSLSTVTTAVPFLMIQGDAAQNGLAQIGVVSSSFYHETSFNSNPALLANGRKFVAARSNFVPWLRSLAPDINLWSNSIAYSINEHHSIGFYHKYFSLGNIHFTDNQGNFIREFNPYEHQVQLNYATWFTNGISIGTAVKYIHSDLTDGLNVGGQDTEPGRSVAFDLGIHHRRHRKLSKHFGLTHAAGFSLNNLGMKLGYTQTGEKDFIPANMQLGIQVGLTELLTDWLRIEEDLSYQVTKLLVPTPPTYLRSVDGSSDSLNTDGERIIESGMDPNVSVPQGWIQSFYDAPGGSLEEWREVTHQVAYEMRAILFEKFAVHTRAGFFYEHATKGNRQFVSTGAGVSFFGFRIDFARYFPINSPNALDGTMAFTIGYRARLGEGSKLRLPKWRPEKENLYPSDIEFAEDDEEETTD